MVERTKDERHYKKSKVNKYIVEKTYRITLRRSYIRDKFKECHFKKGITPASQCHTSTILVNEVLETREMSGCLVILYYED